jgi:DNA repair exonuclease SbcCD ATPase subunit
MTRIEELEQALRLHLAVSPDDPLIIEPVEQEVVRLRARLEAVERERDHGIVIHNGQALLIERLEAQLTTAQARVRELEQWNERQGNMLSSERGTLNDYKQQRDSLKQQHTTLTARCAKLEAALKAIVHADERGQGLPFKEAMDKALVLLTPPAPVPHE